MQTEFSDKIEMDLEGGQIAQMTSLESDLEDGSESIESDLNNSSTKPKTTLPTSFDHTKMPEVSKTAEVILLCGDVSPILKSDQFTEMMSQKSLKQVSQEDSHTLEIGGPQSSIQTWMALMLIFVSTFIAGTLFFIAFLTSNTFFAVPGLIIASNVICCCVGQYQSNFS